MNTRSFCLSAALMLALPALSIRPAAAQSSASAPTAASAPLQFKPARVLPTPAESRARASPPGELRPERPVAPQISIPLGNKPAPEASKPMSRAAPRGNPALTPASTGGVDDAAARCGAQSQGELSALCRDRLARETPSRRPG